MCNMYSMIVKLQDACLEHLTLLVIKRVILMSRVLYLCHWLSSLLDLAYLAETCAFTLAISFSSTWNLIGFFEHVFTKDFGLLAFL